MTNATRVGLAAAGGALASWMALAGPPAGVPSIPLSQPAILTGADPSGVDQTQQWTRLSAPGTCLPERPARAVAAYHAGEPGEGAFWIRFDGADGAPGAGPVVELALRGNPPWPTYADVEAAVEGVHRRIVGEGWPALRGFWAVTRDPSGLPLVWLGPRVYDGAGWRTVAKDSGDLATSRRYDAAAVADGDRGVWVPLRVAYECPPPATGCTRLAVELLTTDGPTGRELELATAAGAARYGIPDLRLVPEGLRGGGGWVVGHDVVYLLPGGRAVPAPGLDAAAGIGGYLTAAARDLQGRLIVAEWTERRDPRGLSHAVTLHVLAGAGWEASANLSDGPLFDGNVAYDRITLLAVDDKNTLWIGTYGGRLAAVRIDDPSSPRVAGLWQRKELGLRDGERLLDLAVDANDIVLLGTTEGVIADRPIALQCPAGGRATPSETPRASNTPDLAPSSPTPTEVPRATPTATPTPPVVVTPTAEATRVAPPRPAYFPAVLSNHPPVVGGDVVWLVDRSASMNARAGQGRQSWLGAVGAVLRAHAGGSRPEAEHVAVVAFDDTTEVLSPLVGDGDALRRAVARLGTDGAGGSRLDLGLVVARRELSGPARRRSAPATVIIFSDGPTDGAPAAEEVRRAAEALAADGVAVWAVALGADADRGWLSGAAGAARVRSAVDALALDDALTRIERLLRAGR